MPATWQLFSDDPDERAAFADLPTTLARPCTPAAPRNRLRHVVRIEVAGRRYFLKTFAATQWKNRLHFLLSAPRASNDAERELRVTEALRERGFRAPRPVAYGHDGPTSYYLCAELAGEPLAQRIENGTLDAELARAAAAHCGELLAGGFRLPDLSADHVFVDDSDGSVVFAVLDLHNGGIVVSEPGVARPPAPSPGKLLSRVLRRFARSVRNLPVSRRLAMRFAARLLRTAGAPRRTRRRLLTAAQPFGTAARYERQGRSQSYADRNPRRSRRERDLLQRVWPGQPGETVLDLPCGAGRLLPFLREHGHRVVQADGAMAMLRQVDRDGLRGELMLQADALRPPFADGAVDGVVMFRFLHHLPPDAARQAIVEACRLARRLVVVSFFHPCSLHHVQRRLRQLLGSPRTRFAMRLGAVRAIAERHGFTLARTAAQLPYGRDLWLVAFTRMP